ncbi:MAG TPA: hypothetical protein VGP63_14370 [Planctomycetaceae bacterium]|jgi:hypothetical protein|nr:hypothetical protein [Planctomycetaceae bacterium]
MKLHLATTPNRSATVMSDSMIDSETADDSEAHAWVRSHVIGFFATIGVVIGLVIADSKIEEIIGQKAMPLFRTVLLVSVLLAGLGARALVAWRSATVDLQGRIFLTLTGLVLLTGAAFGMSNCLQEIREHLKTRDSNPTLIRDFFPLQTALPGGEESGEL